MLEAMLILRMAMHEPEQANDMLRVHSIYAPLPPRTQSQPRLALNQGRLPLPLWNFVSIAVERHLILHIVAAPVHVHALIKCGRAWKVRRTLCPPDAKLPPGLANAARVLDTLMSCDCSGAAGLLL